MHCWTSGILINHNKYISFGYAAGTAAKVLTLLGLITPDSSDWNVSAIYKEDEAKDDAETNLDFFLVWWSFVAINLSPCKNVLKCFAFFGLSICGTRFFW